MQYSVQSPPIIVRDVVIHGSSIADRRIMKEAVPGWVRAWDARTGEHKWDFHTVPQAGDEGVETWLNGSWEYSGNANVWSMLSGDDELGYVLSSNRHPDERTTTAVTGWVTTCSPKAWCASMWKPDRRCGTSRQCTTDSGTTISRPIPICWTSWSTVGRFKAIAQVSKQGFVYTFDRVTGEPVWPIEERPVPTETNLPGEVPSPTQPFPTRPAAFEYQGVTVDDLVDFTPEIRQLAIEAVEGFRLGPLFTPP